MAYRIGGDKQEEAGRYVVADRDIRAGEIIMSSEVYCFGIFDSYKKKICQTCLTYTPSPLSVTCPHCNQVWYCNSECASSDSSLHSHAPTKRDVSMCKALRKIQMIAKGMEPYHLLLLKMCVLVVCRKRKDMNSAEFKILNDLVGNQDKISSSSLDDFRYIAHLFTTQVMPNTEDILSKEDLIRIMCIEQCNSFGIWGEEGEWCGLGIYPSLSFFNHSSQRIDNIQSLIYMK
eukprot:TRINITY_DN4504_c0_g1_i1.p1 TRINITY_DN4504_c0_g1~~TRINITY_DN4504_c0_g1_i1.p1  ORF type:complete len:232 (+),score=40.64 TRINITY_DN4504_c0_g1_i1:29-724(+)